MTKEDSRRVHEKHGDHAANKRESGDRSDPENGQSDRITGSAVFAEA